ncbi:MAG: bifunctional nuclease family protein [Acidobacteria bacterium]|nr:bifunctional nuclease family protein [Acidobacteriota bacterium]
MSDESTLAPVSAADVFRVVQVADVVFDVAVSTAFVVLREAEGRRRELRVPVALHDATAVHHAWQRVPGPRPTSGELTTFILQELRADVVAMRIVRHDAGVYYAELDVMTAQGRRVFDARPSDAITLALRQSVPAPLLVADVMLPED